MNINGISAINPYSAENGVASSASSGIFQSVLEKELEKEITAAENTSYADEASEKNEIAKVMMYMLMGSLGGVGSETSGGMSEVLTSLLLYLFMDRDEKTGVTSSSSTNSASITKPTKPQTEEEKQKLIESYEPVVNAAIERLGDPYSQPKAGEGDYTDCSYLTRWCYREVGLELPRTAAAQGKYCVDNDIVISKEELLPGDLIFYSLKDNGRFMDISHVAIYAGDGMMVDASSARGEVVYRPVYDKGQVLYGRPNAMFV